MLAGQTYSQWDEQWRDRLLLTWVVASTSGPEASGSYPRAFAPLRSLHGQGERPPRGEVAEGLQCVLQEPGEKRHRGLRIRNAPLPSADGCAQSPCTLSWASAEHGICPTYPTKLSSCPLHLPRAVTFTSEVWRCMCICWLQATEIHFSTKEKTMLEGRANQRLGGSLGNGKRSSEVEREKPLAGRQEAGSARRSAALSPGQPLGSLARFSSYAEKSWDESQGFSAERCQVPGHLGDDQEPLLEGSREGAAVSLAGICTLPTSETGRRGICECFLVTSYRSQLSWPQRGDLY